MGSIHCCVRHSVIDKQIQIAHSTDWGGKQDIFYIALKNSINNNKSILQYSIFNG